MHKKIFVLCCYVALLLLVGCGAPRIIDDADEVKISYILRFPDGALFESGTLDMVIGQAKGEIQTFQDVIL